MADPTEPGVDATDAFEALFRAHYAGLCSFVVGYLHSEDEARDIVHDLFLALLEKHEAGGPASYTSAYLYSAARNRALKRLRHHRVVTRWQEQAADSGTPQVEAADHTLRFNEAAEAAEAAIAQLPDRCREVFLLSRRQHMTYAEIAATLDLSVKTVEVQMWRALKKLREQLAPFISPLLLIASTSF